jgi:hypothetical protein
MKQIEDIKMMQKVRKTLIKSLDDKLFVAGGLIRLLDVPVEIMERHNFRYSFSVDRWEK